MLKTAWIRNLFQSLKMQSKFKSRRRRSRQMVEALEARVVLTAPVGVIDKINADGTVQGWSYDPNTPSQALNVDFYVDGVFDSRTLTAVSRPDVNSAFNITGTHGFLATISSKYYDGKQHNWTMYALDTSGLPPNPAIGSGNFTIPLTNHNPTVSHITFQPAGGLLDQINGTITDPDLTAGASISYQVIVNVNGNSYISPTPLVASTTNVNESTYSRDFVGYLPATALPPNLSKSTTPTLQLQIKAINVGAGSDITTNPQTISNPYYNVPASPSTTVNFQSAFPSNFSDGANSTGLGAYYYQEQSNRYLSSDLPVSASGVGNYIGTDTQFPSYLALKALGQSSPYPGVGSRIPLGSSYSSYVLDFDPPNDGLTYIQSQITFPNPILGVIAQGTDLHASDGIVGRQSVVYSDNGLEIADGLLDFDSFRILPDMHTVAFALRAGEQDVMRVITQADPPPPPPPPPNQPPQFQGANFNLADNTPNGSTVGTLTASDPNVGASISFSITAGNSLGAFAISSDGVISVADSTKLNYGANPLLLTVVVTDSFGLSASNTVTINLIHVKTPSNIVLSNSSITEGLAAGTTVGQFTNPDLPGVAVQYSLVAGSGGDDNSSFTIDSSGVLRSTAIFDYDVKNSYSILVRATDPWGLTYDKVFTISVIDVYEAPVFPAQSFSLADNLPNGSIVGTIAASVDAGDSLAFSIVGGNSLGAFSVSSAGVITVADSTKLSFLNNPVYKLTVTATDSLNLSSTNTVTVNLIEAKPPVLAGIEGSPLIHAESTPVAVTTSITAVAPDSLTLNSAIIQIAGGYQNSSDSLQFTNTSTISGTWNAGTGTLTLSGSDTVADYQAALRSVSFQNTGINTAPRTITFQVSDGFLPSNTVSRVVDAPPNVLSLVTAGLNPTSGPAIQFTVTFSEGVTGVTSTNFSFVETGFVAATGILVAAVSPSVYTITVNGVIGTGTLGVNLSKPDNIIDSGNNALTGTFTGQVVTVDTTPVVTLQPTNFTVAAGGAASFTAAASGFPTPNTQWQVSTDGGSTWGNISGATSATYSFVTATTDNGSEYRAVFTNAVGSVTSSIATLTVTQAPFATVYWTGLGDGHSWSNAANWSTHALPGANDDVLINAASGTIIHGPTAAATVRSLTISSANFYVDGAFLTVTNGVVVGNGQSLTIGNYSSLIPGSISLNGASLTLSLNGTIKGGTVTETGGANIAVVDSGVLDGVTINGNMSVTHANNGILTLKNTVTLNGTLLIGATDSSTWATLFFSDAAAGAVTLAGNASVVFGGSTSNGIDLYDNGGTITFGLNVTLHGNNGRIANNFYTGTVLFQGTVAADVVGGTISFAYSSVTYQNSGTLTSINGGTLALNNTWTNTGTVTSTGSGNVVLAGVMNNSAGTINLDGSLTLEQNGTVKGGTINETPYGNVAVVGTGILDGTTVNGNINVSHANNDFLVLRGTVTLNGTLFIGATDGSTSATLFFRDDTGGAITLAGNATVVFGGNTANAIDFYDNGGTITFGSNVTLRGQNGRVTNTYYAGTILFEGTVAADVAGGTINIALSSITYQNSGILAASNGGTLELSANWKNTGSINSSSGGNVLLLGAVDNSQGTFTLDGLLTMQGGQGCAITGGTITEKANGNISVVTAAILDSVTINGNISLTHATGDYLILRNNVTLNGTLFIGATDGSTSNVVYLGYGSTNPVTLTGNATLVFGGGTNNTIDNYLSPGTATLSSTVTVRGKTGRLINNSANGSFLNQGTISADVSGGTITASNYAGTYQNTGTFEASNGGVLVVSGAGITNSLAGLIESPTGTIQFGSSLLTTATNPALLNPQGNVTFNLNANAASAKLLEATSQDLGNTAAGFVNNSAFGSLNLTNGTYVQLVNQTSNTGGSKPDAVYVDSLTVDANTTLDLNNVKLYVLNATIHGNVIGTINVVGVAPTVTTQPSSTTVLSGTTASFTAAATGTLTPTVQWQVSTNSGSTWNDISGATSTTYSFTASTGNSGSQYRAVFTNQSGTVTTNAATLTVTSANVASTSVQWGTSGSATLLDASGGRLLPTGRTNDIDWFNISSLTITLDRSIPSLAPADVSVIGSVGGSYGSVRISGSGTTWVITLAKVIANADKVIVTIGNTQLTTYQRELDVLPGDYNDDGVVSSADVTLLNNATVAPYNLFADLNGDGLIDINDGKLARGKIGTKRVS